MTDPKDIKRKPTDPLDDPSSPLDAEVPEDPADEPTEEGGTVWEDDVMSGSEEPDDLGDADDGGGSELTGDLPLDGESGDPDPEVEAAPEDGEDDEWDDDDLLVKDNEDMLGLDEEESEAENASDGLDQPVEGGLFEAEWGALEDERGALTPGRIVVGHKEFVAFPDLAMSDVVARLDTGCETSSLRVPFEALPDGRLRVTLAGRTAELRAEARAGGPVVHLRTVLGPLDRVVPFLIAPAESIAVVLGRDWLEGYAVVDVALGFVHLRSKE